MSHISATTDREKAELIVCTVKGNCMAEYLSKGTGVTLGTLGTIGFGTSILQGLQSGNGLLGGLLGGNNCQQNQLSALLSENAMLKSENYADKIGKEVYSQSLIDNNNLSDRIFDKYLNPISTEIANNRVEMARLQEQLKCCCEKQELREQIINGRINEVALIANNGITALQGQVACLAQTVSGITKTVVPITAVCPQPMPEFNSWTAPTTTG